MFQAGRIKGPHRAEVGFALSPESPGTVGSYEADATLRVHVGQRCARHGHFSNGVVTRAQNVGHRFRCRGGDETMDRSNAQLLSDEFSHVGEGRFRGGSNRCAGGTCFVAVRAGDRIPVVAIGDDHGLRRDRSGDCGDASGVGDAFDAVFDTLFVGEGADAFSWFLEEIGQARAEGESPYGRKIRERGAGEVETVGLRLGGGSLVGENPACALVDNLECAEDSDGASATPGIVGERHAVEGEGRLRVHQQSSLVAPAREFLCCRVVATGSVFLHRNVDPHDVAGMAGRVVGAVVSTENVVRGRRQGHQVVVGIAVPQRRKGFETRHTLRVADAQGQGKTTDPVGVVFSDLDGVIWRTHSAIEGSAEAVGRLQSAGWRVVFVTNNGSATPAEQEAKLAGFGIDARGDVITSAMAATLLVQPGERALVCAGPGVLEAMRNHGVEVVDVHDVLEDDVHSRVGSAPDVDVVVVAFHKSFGFDTLRIGTECMLKGARLVGTNDDATYPTAEGSWPGGGSMLAAFAYAGSRTPIVAGKPFAPIAQLARQLVPRRDGRVEVMVGDRPSTDGAFAAALGVPYAQVWSGVLAPCEGPVDGVNFDMTGSNFAEIADRLLGL